MSYIEGVERNQKILFPEAIDDYIKDDNEVQFIEAFVNSIDLAKLGFTHTVDALTGRSPYNPADLVKLYIYGYLNRIRSSRSLEIGEIQTIEGNF